MKPNTMLTVASLAALLLMTLHLSDDVVRGFSPGGLGNLTVVVAIAIWLFVALVLAERRAGMIIMLILGLLGSGVPVLHMMGRGMVGGRVAGTNGMVFWVWTLLAGGGVSLFSAVLAARALWLLRRSTTGASAPARGTD